MRARIHRHWRWGLAGALAATLLTFTEISAAILPDVLRNNCSYENPDSQDYCSGYGLAQAVIIVFVDCLTGYAAAVGAIATALIAWFTWELRRSTNKLWDASLEPPRIEVRQAHIDFDNIAKGAKPIGGVYVFNSGGKDANIAGIGNSKPATYGNIILYVGRHPPARKPFDCAWKANPLAIKGGVLKAGESQWWEITDDSMVAPADLANAQHGRDGMRLYMIGRVHFMDPNGSYRQTVFCRVYDPETERFMPTNDFDYEYVH